MSYQVIARKYRPPTFDELVGQENVVRPLKNAIKLNRVAHAYLFSGPRGTGKTTSARILAKSLNCVEGPTATPCLSCPSCREIAGNGSIDVLEIDGASNRGINEIRDLKEKINYRPSRDRFKIYIIDEVHMLTTEAFNALLKTLEEPPGHVKFIFATTEAHKIPRTILSRCQRYTFKLLPLVALQLDLERILAQEGLSYDEGAIRLIVDESEGSVRDAQSLLEQAIAGADGHLSVEIVRNLLGLTERADLLSLLRNIRNGDAGSILETVERATLQGVDVTKLSLTILKLLRDVVTRAAGLSKENWRVLTGADEAYVDEVCAGTDFDYWYRLYKVWARSVDEIHRSYLPREAAEVALLRLARTPASLDLSQLVDVVQGLKQTLPSNEAQAASAPARQVPAPAVPPAAVPEPPRASPAPALAEAPKTEKLAPDAKLETRTVPTPEKAPVRTPRDRQAAAAAPRRSQDDSGPPLSAYENEGHPEGDEAFDRSPKGAPTPAPAPRAAATEATPPAVGVAPKPAPAVASAPRASTGSTDTAAFPWEEPLGKKATPAPSAPALQKATAPAQESSPRPVAKAAEAWTPESTAPTRAQAITTENFAGLLETLTGDRGGSLKMVIPLIADLELLEAGKGKLVIGVPLGSDHAILAAGLKKRTELVERAAEAFSGMPYRIEWRDIAAEKRVDQAAEAMEELHQEVEQLPIFGQLKKEFGAELRRGDKRR